MADALFAHLAALPEPQINRIATSVLGGALQTRALTERAIAQRLLDASWVDGTLRRLGNGARTALTTLFHAGVPVLRRDVSALAQRQSSDPVDDLEEHGLVTAVRTGRGMPTHVALVPGLEGVLQSHLEAARPEAGTDGLLHAGARRRFELAVMVSIVAQHPPRLTRDGRLHARDLRALTDQLDPLGHRSAAMEGRLARWLDAGAVTPNAGRLCIVASVATDIPAFQQRLALNELATPAVPDGALAAVRVLLAATRPMPLREVLDAAQTALLRNRAEADETQLRRGARRELLDVMTALLSLEAVVLLDGAGYPLLGSGDDLFQRAATGEDLGVALDPVVAAALNGTPPPQPAMTTGHVQSSFEIVADVTCDPSLIARIGICSRVVRADRAAVLQLERDSVRQGRAAGVTLESLLEALAALSGRPVPLNVRTVLRDWYDAAPEGAVGIAPEGGATDFATLRGQALAALAAVTS